jgi:glycolate oxidase
VAIVHASVADVQATLRIASATGTPVVRGAGTGLAGGANAGAGEIVLSMRGWTASSRCGRRPARSSSPASSTPTSTRLAAHGLWAPDPASRAISTVGGNIATGAGGLLCAKYGVVRDAVLGVDLVLADGRLLRLGHRSVKGVTGLDRRLVIGSEGTLGVVVGATLKLRASSRQARTLTALFRRSRRAPQRPP